MDVILQQFVVQFGLPIAVAFKSSQVKLP